MKMNVDIEQNMWWKKHKKAVVFSVVKFEWSAKSTEAYSDGGAMAL